MHPVSNLTLGNMPHNLDTVLLLFTLLKLKFDRFLVLLSTNDLLFYAEKIKNLQEKYCIALICLYIYMQNPTLNPSPS